MNKEIPVLYRNKSECCACGACMNVCPQKAITMCEDEYGFFYPQIEESACIGCMKCKSVCSFQNIGIKNEPIETYAAVARDSEMVKRSASGGIFAALAQSVIQNGGIAVGAELQADFSVKHIIVDDLRELCKIQGSKYTQSSINQTYEEVIRYLRDGRQVLFSGTPCQVAGLYGYLGKDYENLLTVDIICHGVPNNKMLQDYIKNLEKRFGAPATAFTFRDKSMGWGLNGSICINGRKKNVWQSSSSYLYYFSRGWIYRENCYKCKYACKHRPADITIGDFWGIEKQHPDYLGNAGWNEAKGVSAVIVNSKKGKEHLSLSHELIDIKPSTFEKAAIGNEQLRKPCNPGKREELLSIYKKHGWEGLEKRFNKNIGLKYYSSQIKSILPVAVKRIFKALR